MLIKQIILIKIKKLIKHLLLLNKNTKNKQFIVGEFKVRIFWHSL